LSHVEYFVNNVYVGRGTNSATKFALDYTKVVWNSSYAVRAVAVDKLGATGASNSFSIATPKPFSYNLLPLNSGTELYARFALPTTKPASLTLEVVQYNALGALLGTWSQTYTSGFATGANRLCFQSKFPKKHTGTNFVMKLKSGSTLLASTSSFAL
jgi:hypothetical protein